LKVRPLASAFSPLSMNSTCFAEAPIDACHGKPFALDSTTKRALSLAPEITPETRSSVRSASALISTDSVWATMRSGSCWSRIGRDFFGAAMPARSTTTGTPQPTSIAPPEYASILKPLSFTDSPPSAAASMRSTASNSTSPHMMNLSG
jgi:hypothetical protein